MIRTLLPGSTLVALVAACALAAGSGTAGGALRSHLIAGMSSIAGYRVGARWTTARRLLGGPVSSTQSSSVCQARWSGGLTIAWKRRPQYVTWPKACITFSWAKMTGRGWRTDTGLRIGNSVSQLTRLYPAATHRKSGGFVVWSLASSPKRTLQAWVKGNRIRYFRVTRR